ncbi:MAG TPA: YidC/Oxa1 family membrane protein insertase [bacterium]|jgi:YidC/Oxa1 family membrane protein insertase|nr:YidC/Oxa1 family membrane protein insertase [bacterium]HOG38508.1 YidC/Oxa1 family membrane protein insertase [bacterium]HQI03489.1 YidC/Oxa1 family membrane protein insertase [bacterium]
MIAFFKVVLYYPIFNLLVFFYNLIPDIGIAIIFVTIIIKIIIWPLSKKSMRSQKAMQTIQPKLEALQTQYKGDQQALARATMELYKQEDISPFSSCLTPLIQLPIMISVFYAFRNGLVNTNFDFLYSFVKNPGTINPMMFNILDLSKPQWILGVFAGTAQFFQSRLLMQKKKDKQEINTDNKSKELSLTETMTKQMTYTMPIVTVLISLSLPGGLALYFFVITLLGILEAMFFTKPINKKQNNQVEVIN